LILRLDGAAERGDVESALALRRRTRVTLFVPYMIRANKGRPDKNEVKARYLLAEKAE
jgi:hypothetical protein